MQRRRTSITIRMCGTHTQQSVVSPQHCTLICKVWRDALFFFLIMVAANFKVKMIIREHWRELEELPLSDAVRVSRIFWTSGSSRTV
jgi:hypothetical protein